jgi:DNA topoisomerase-1
MAKNLVIVESPAKAKTINKILGADYMVRASMGHVRDLPEKGLGVDIENGFKPKYVTIKSREKVLRELKEAAEKAQRVFLAPDPDREGEAIAWHLMHALKSKVPEDRFCRVTYNEITASAIRKAFSEPGRIDQHKVDSQQARRILDRLVGYIVSPLLWRRIRGAMSAGRVQSVALRLVCEREREIEQFKPEEFWLVGARVRKEVEPRTPFEIRLVKINGEKTNVNTGGEAARLREDVEGRKLVVSDVSEREVSKRPWPPFITSTLQQSASSVLGFAPAYTMKLAQKLYEGVDLGEGQGPVGLITYMRTDSVHVSSEAQSACRDLIREQFGADFLPDKAPVYRSKESAQEAHEAIRPTDVRRRPEDVESALNPDELKLYRLIWNRFVASQMAPARWRRRTVDIEALPDERRKTAYLFRVSASDLLFPGYMRVTGAEEARSKRSENGEEDEAAEAEALPPLEKGEPLEWLEWLQEQKFTQPPPRYTEAALIKALEEDGVGRPSTYAQILSTLLARKYVTKEKRALKPTDMGRQVNDFLVRHLGRLFDVKFTAGMEEKLDRIESGAVDWAVMLREFYEELAAWVEQAKGPPADPDKVRQLLDLLARVKEWDPPRKKGKRTYSDEKFAASIRDQLAEGKPISGAQWEALQRLAARYSEQVPEIRAQADALGLKEALESAAQAAEPPSEATLRKLELLEKVEFHEPRQVGRRTFDDRAFVESLRKQVQSGRRLSEKQIHHLDRILVRYAGQVPGFAEMAGDLKMETPVQAKDEESGPLLALLENVKDWKPAVQRGKRLWDDRKFYDSLLQQYRRQKRLSPRQVAALKKLAARYAAQIPNYEAAAEQYGLRQRSASTHPETKSS